MTNASSAIEICVDWSGGDPEPGDDFTVDYTDLDFPDVELASAGDWRVWSQDKNNSNIITDIGNLTSDPTEAGNFEVTLRRADGTAGADDVKSFVLDPNPAQRRTNIRDSVITGSITGSEFAQNGSQDAGGELELDVPGDVDGNIDAFAIVGDGLTIDGELGGDLILPDNGFIDTNVTVDIGSVVANVEIDIDEMKAGSKFRVAGKVGVDSQTWLRQLAANVDIDFGYGETGDYDMDGNVDIIHTPAPGIPATVEIKVFGNLGGSLALSNDLSGTATVLGNVEQGGELSLLGLDGTVAVGDVTHTSSVNGSVCMSDIANGGAFTITGDVGLLGDIDLLLRQSGILSVDGDVVGEIIVGSGSHGGEVLGPIDIGGDLSGSLTILAGTSIDGDLDDAIDVEVVSLPAQSQWEAM